MLITKNALYLLSAVVKTVFMDIETVKKVASLSRLKVADENLDIYAKQLTGILEFVEQLGEVDTDGVEPLSSPVDMTARLREDMVNDGGIAPDILANAPETVEGFFVVPKVVE